MYCSNSDSLSGVHITREGFKMCEKRLYQRLRLNIDCICCINGVELQANLKDISESGIAIEVTPKAPEIESLKVDDTIKFWGMDSFMYLNFMRQTVIYGTGKVVRFDEEDNKVLIGCKLVYNECLQEYIKDRKVAKYISSGFFL